MGDTLIFFQMKGFVMIHNRGKFHIYSVCGCQFINFQMFLGDAASMNLAILGVFWAVTPPNMVQLS